MDECLRVPRVAFAYPPWRLVRKCICFVEGDRGQCRLIGGAMAVVWIPVCLVFEC